MQRNAWHLILANTKSIAIAQTQIIEYLCNQTTFIIPDCSDWCNQVISWRQRILPVMGYLNSHETQHQHILIIHHQSSESDETLMALSLSAPPIMISVDDKKHCQPNQELSQFWHHSISSCFEQDGSPVPIINFSQLQNPGN